MPQHLDKPVVETEALASVTGIIVRYVLLLGGVFVAFATLFWFLGNA